jgi:triosephosphate isomerase
LFSKKCRSLIALFTVVFILGVSLYCYAYLPILDFRPYKTGNNINELMQIPEGAETDVYETTFIYEKDGVQQTFSMDNYPKGDTGWTFVETINKLIKKGYEPPIHDFTITTEDGDDITGEILTDAGYTFLLIAHKLEEADDSNIDKINTLYDYARQNEYRFICLTASLPQQITEWKESTGAEYPFCTMDDIALKTIIRSNPGLMLLHDATIVNKWADRKIPGEKDLQSTLENSTVGLPPVNQDVRNIVLLALLLLIPLIGLFIWDRKNRIIN